MIRLNVPLTGSEELAEVKSVLDSGYLTQGPKVVEFENGVKEILGIKHAFAMSSATTSLHLSLVAMGIGHGDEVLVSDFTYPASGNVIIQRGATPVCVDVLKHTYAMDPEDLERRITSKSKAIMVVHPFGLSADMDPILKLAKQHDLLVIEDAACALGATYKSRFCGSMGNIGCFSFHPRKSITTGEGGMIVTNSDDIVDSIQLLRSHGGRRQEFYFEFEEAGYNYRLSDVLAAIGVAQLKRLNHLIDTRRGKASILTDLISNIEGLTTPVEPEGLKHSYQSYVVLLDSQIDRNAVIRDMRERGVECTLGTYAMHSQPSFRKRAASAAGDLKVSEELFRQTLTLPLHQGLSDSDFELIGESLSNSIEKRKN